MDDETLENICALAMLVIGFLLATIGFRFGLFTVVLVAIFSAMATKAILAGARRLAYWIEAHWKARIVY